MTIARIYACLAAGLSVTYLIGVAYLYLMSNFYLGNVMPLGQAV